MKRFLTLLSLIVLTACSGVTSTANPTPTTEPLPTATVPAPTETGTASTETSLPVAVPETPAATSDPFTQSGITLPTPTCESGLTPQDTEGPYFKAGSPERISMIEPGIQGERLTLVGYVLDQNCQPITGAKIDFWQADANGEYDNSGYVLRGHQFTDEQGRYYLETVMPGLYGSRPIMHIHVKVQPPQGNEIISQIYFPDQPVPNQTATIEAREGFYVGYFNFVVQE